MFWMKIGIASLVFIVGVRCLNYTKGTGFEHHMEWATEHHTPPPG